MDDLSQLTAAPCTAIVDGRVFRLRPLTLEDYGEIVNCIRGGRPDPSAELPPRLAELSREEQAAAWGRVFDRLAAQRRVTLDELDRWWQSPEGFCGRFWLMIRKDRPEAELNEAAALFRRMSAEGRGALIRRMEDCDGLPVFDPTAQTYAPAEGGVEAAAAPPWWEWARRLSRLYGWTPAEIARMTVAQIWIYLSDGAAAGRGGGCRWPTPWPIAPRGAAAAKRGFAGKWRMRDDDLVQGACRFAHGKLLAGGFPGGAAVVVRL